MEVFVIIVKTLIKQYKTDYKEKTTLLSLQTIVFFILIFIFFQSSVLYSDSFSTYFYSKNRSDAILQTYSENRPKLGPEIIEKIEKSIPSDVYKGSAIFQSYTVEKEIFGESGLLVNGSFDFKQINSDEILRDILVQKLGLTRGRLPVNGSEILVAQPWLVQLNLEINSTISVENFNGDFRVLHIVGSIEPLAKEGLYYRMLQDALIFVTNHGDTSLFSEIGTPLDVSEGFIRAYIYFNHDKIDKYNLKALEKMNNQIYFKMIAEFDEIAKSDSDFIYFDSLAAFYMSNVEYMDFLRIIRNSFFTSIIAVLILSEVLSMIIILIYFTKQSPVFNIMTRFWKKNDIFKFLTLDLLIHSSLSFTIALFGNIILNSSLFGVGNLFFINWIIWLPCFIFVSGLVIIIRKINLNANVKYIQESSMHETYVRNNIFKENKRWLVLLGLLILSIVLYLMSSYFIKSLLLKSVLPYLLMFGGVLAVLIIYSKFKYTNIHIISKLLLRFLPKRSIYRKSDFANNYLLWRKKEIIIFVLFLSISSGFVQFQSITAHKEYDANIIAINLNLGGNYHLINNGGIDSFSISEPSLVNYSILELSHIYLQNVSLAGLDSFFIPIDFQGYKNSLNVESKQYYEQHLSKYEVLGPNEIIVTSELRDYGLSIGDSVYLSDSISPTNPQENRTSTVVIVGFFDYLPGYHIRDKFGNLAHSISVYYPIISNNKELINNLSATKNSILIVGDEGSKGEDFAISYQSENTISYKSVNSELKSYETSLHSVHYRQVIKILTYEVFLFIILISLIFIYFSRNEHDFLDFLNFWDKKDSINELKRAFFSTIMIIAFLYSVFYIGFAFIYLWLLSDANFLILSVSMINFPNSIEFVTALLICPIFYMVNYFSHKNNRETIVRIKYGSENNE